MPKTWNVYVYSRGLHAGRVRRTLPKGRSEFFLTNGRYVYGLTAKSRKGICIVAQWVRGDRHFGRAAVMHEWEYPSMAIRKREVAKTDVQHLASMESEHMKDHLALLEHCALRKYEDGSEREVGWYVTKCVGAAWVIQVKDPDSCMSFSAVADTYDKALDTANLLLACDEAPWEHDTWLAKSKMEKQKKK